MNRLIAALSVVAVLGCGVVTASAPAEAAYVTSRVTAGPGRITESRTVHTGFGRRTVRVSEGRLGRVCRSGVTVKRLPGRTVRSVRRICR